MLRKAVQAYDALWNNLPDYISEGENSIVVADVSGSMTGLPMSVSISLAIYLAERNSGRFHNHFITFSASPRLQEINGNTITEKVHYLHKAEWSMNTNLQAVFDLILDTARKYKTSKNELPEKICKLLKYGFYPAGGGKFEITINPVQKLKPLFMSEKGNLVRKSVCGIVSVIPYKIARDEVSIVCSDLGWDKNCGKAMTVTSSELRFQYQRILQKDFQKKQKQIKQGFIIFQKVHWRKCVII